MQGWFLFLHLFFLVSRRANLTIPLSVSSTRCFKGFEWSLLCEPLPCPQLHAVGLTGSCGFLARDSLRHHGFMCTTSAVETSATMCIDTKAMFPITLWCLASSCISIRCS
uniref:Secreted protein n=1 Tax=Triticum urartu TaxID=4572 RepID=A0A8R7UP81_TRIUA